MEGKASKRAIPSHQGFWKCHAVENLLRQHPRATDLVIESCLRRCTLQGTGQKSGWRERNQDREAQKKAEVSPSLGMHILVLDLEKTVKAVTTHTSALRGERGRG